MHLPIPPKRLWALVLLSAVLLGCGKTAPQDSEPPHVPRPVAGDRVTPDVLVAGVWKAGKVAYLNLRCTVQGPGEARPAFLQSRDVAEEILPQATVTFLAGERELERRADLAMERSCWGKEYLISVEMNIPPETTAARLRVHFAMPIAGVEFTPCEVTVPVVREPSAS